MYEKGLSRGMLAYIYKIQNLILRVGGGGNLKNMDFSKIIFTRFCRYKRRMQLLFKLLFDISHRSRDIPRKRKFCIFFKG